MMPNYTPRSFYLKCLSCSFQHIQNILQNPSVSGEMKHSKMTACNFIFPKEIQPELTFFFLFHLKPEETLLFNRYLSFTYSGFTLVFALLFVLPLFSVKVLFSSTLISSILCCPNTLSATTDRTEYTGNYNSSCLLDQSYSDLRKKKIGKKPIKNTKETLTIALDTEFGREKKFPEEIDFFLCSLGLI